jgi:hypothetical protein
MGSRVMKEFQRMSRGVHILVRATLALQIQASTKCLLLFMRCLGRVAIMNQASLAHNNRACSFTE